MSKTIYLRLQGGLGNQLFQWAFAHYCLKQVPSKSLKVCHSDIVDASKDYSKVPIGRLLLTCSHLAPASKLVNSIVARHRYISRLWDNTWQRDFLESSFGYFREDPRINVEQSQTLDLWRSRILSGYFQSFRYVSAASKMILPEIDPIVHLSFKKAKDVFRLPNEYSSVHVRSGDYFAADLKNPLVIGRLEESYYLQISSQIIKRPLVLLAPSLKNIEKIVEILNPDLILTEQETSAWSTLAIMANSSYFYGANSSLSWWGAWLSSLYGNHVFLPSSWSEQYIINDSEYEFPGLKRITAFWESS